MGEDKPMSKKWVFAMLLVLSVWLGPALFMFAKSHTLKKEADYTDQWNRYIAKANFDYELQKSLFEIRRAKYSRGSSDEPESNGTEVEVVYVDRPIVTERVVEKPVYQNQPDLTGAYWQRNFGTFQYVMGPF